MPPGGDDLPFRLAATLAIDLMTAKHGLDEGVAIDVAWSSYKELESVGPNARFQIADYAESVRSAMRGIGAALEFAWDPETGEVRGPDADYVRAVAAEGLHNGVATGYPYPTVYPI